MGLGDSDFDSAVTIDRFERDWTEFLETCGPRPLVAAWNQTTLDVLATTTRGTPSRVSLKSAYRSARGGGSGSLDDVVLRERVSAPRFAFRGRAAVRLARAVAVARDLNENARGAVS
jgi:hypothetical protein